MCLPPSEIVFFLRARQFQARKWLGRWWDATNLAVRSSAVYTNVCKRHCTWHLLSAYPPPPAPTTNTFWPSPDQNFPGSFSALFIFSISILLSISFFHFILHVSVLFSIFFAFSFLIFLYSFLLFSQHLLKFVNIFSESINIFGFLFSFLCISISFLYHKVDGLYAHRQNMAKRAFAPSKPDACIYLRYSILLCSTAPLLHHRFPH